MQKQSSRGVLVSCEFCEIFKTTFFIEHGYIPWIYRSPSAKTTHIAFINNADCPNRFSFNGHSNLKPLNLTAPFKNTQKKSNNFVYFNFGFESQWNNEEVKSNNSGWCQKKHLHRTISKRPRTAFTEHLESKCPYIPVNLHSDILVSET